MNPSVILSPKDEGLYAARAVFARELEERSHKTERETALSVFLMHLLAVAIYCGAIILWMA